MSTFLIIIGAVIAVFGGSLFLQNKKPQIELGLDNGRLKEIPNKKNAVSTQTSYQDKLVEPLAFKKTTKESVQAMKRALKAYGNIEIQQEKNNYIYAIATTGKMKYQDDIEIYFDETNKKVQYRSASRAGYSDMGLNLARYKEIAASYKKF